MRISSLDFEKCGFPEDWLFWLVIMSFLVFLSSFALLHGSIKEGRRSVFFFPVLFLILDEDAFTDFGKFLRLTLIISFVVGTVAVGTVFLWAGSNTGYFDCGNFR